MATDEIFSLLAEMRLELQETIKMRKFTDSLLANIPAHITQEQIEDMRQKNIEIREIEATQHAEYKTSLRMWEIAKANGIVETWKNAKNKD